MTTPEIITPTIGRKVWYRHDGGRTTDINGGQVNVVSYGDQPMDATVIYVWHDRMVNLRITDHAGNTFALSSVNLVQQGDVTPNYRYCEWMPYQKGQAAKAVATALPVMDPGPDSLEREIQAKANKGPRVTPAALQAEIVSEFYFTAFDGVVGAAANVKTSSPFAMVEYDEKAEPGLHLLTFCVLVLRNGAKVVGINYGAIDPAQHSAERGRQEARAQAVDKVYELLGFRLRDELARPVLTDADAAADLAGTPRPDNPTAEAADFLASVKACDLSGDTPCEACQ